MMRRTTPAVLMCILGFAGLCLAMVSISDNGTWPNSWPTELEQYRNQAQTHGVAHGINEDVHEISFTKREEFERAWPHILKLKSKGAPLILERSPSSYGVSGSTAKQGVRILCPSHGLSTGSSEDKMLKAGPPWPDYLKSESGELPEYVDSRDGKWIPTDKGVRARTDIVLIIDAEIVDLNRIQLPPNTPVIDNRFKKE